MWRVIVHWIDFAAPQAVQAPAMRLSSYEIGVMVTIVFLIMYEFSRKTILSSI